MSDDGKIVALKTATKNLLTQLQGAVTINGDVYVSIIPFSKTSISIPAITLGIGSTGPTGSRSLPS
jgi:hypothetical protein